MYLAGSFLLLLKHDLIFFIERYRSHVLTSEQCVSSQSLIQSLLLLKENPPIAITGDGTRLNSLNIYPETNTASAPSRMGCMREWHKIFWSIALHCNSV